MDGLRRGDGDRAVFFAIAALNGQVRWWGPWPWPWPGLRRLPALQLQPGHGLHGGHRDPVPGLPAGGRSAEAEGQRAGLVELHPGGGGAPCPSSIPGWSRPTACASGPGPGGSDHTSHRLVKLGLPSAGRAGPLRGRLSAGMVALALARGGSTWGPCWPCRPWRWSSAPATSWPGSRYKPGPQLRSPKPQPTAAGGPGRDPGRCCRLLLGYLALRGALGRCSIRPFNGPDEGATGSTGELDGQRGAGRDRGGAIAAPLYYALAPAVPSG